MYGENMFFSCPWTCYRVSSSGQGPILCVIFSGWSFLPSEGWGFRDLGPSFHLGSALIHTSSWLVVSCRHSTMGHKDLNPVSLVIQSCLTLYDPMDCSPPGSSTTGFSGQDSRVGSRSLPQGIFLTQRSNPGLLHCRQILYHLYPTEKYGDFF